MIESIPLHIIRKVKSLNLSLGKDVPNQEIGELLNRTILIGGKRFRPLLTYLMSDFFELPLEEMGLFARAIEFTHSATLAHDDVIDQANKRRGKKTLNAAATNKKAILSGDYLLGQTMLELSRTGDIRFIQELSQVLQDLVDGEWRQMENTLDRETSWEQVEQVARKKTASVITWCCVAPALKANVSPEVLSVTRSFGDQLGLAFQEMDDVIDFHAHLDKNTLQDIRNGLLNSVTYTLIKNNPELRADMADMDIDACNFTVPWNLNEMKQAIAEIRASAKARLASCQQDLQKILELQGRSKDQKAQQALQVLKMLLNFLANRQT